MVYSTGASRSASESLPRSPGPKGKLARGSENTTLVNSPDDAGRLASAKATGHTTVSLSPSSISKLQMPVKKNLASAIDMPLKAHQRIDLDDDDDYESSIESLLCSASQMSMSNFSTNSDNAILEIDQLNLKLDAVVASHQMLQYKAQTRLSTHGSESRQYEHYMRKIEGKRFKIVSISQRIEYKKAHINADDNPTMPTSKKNAGRLFVLQADDRMEIPSGITDDRGQIFRGKTINSLAGQKHRLAVTDQEEFTPARGRHRKLETVPDAPSEARGSMDLPATARRSISPTCVSEARLKTLPSRSSTHKSRARTSSTPSTRAKITLEKRPRNTLRGSERGKSQVNESVLPSMFVARLTDENARLRGELERANSNNLLLHQQASVHVDGLT